MLGHLSTINIKHLFFLNSIDMGCIYVNSIALRGNVAFGITTYGDFTSGKMKNINLLELRTKDFNLGRQFYRMWSITLCAT